MPMDYDDDLTVEMPEPAKRGHAVKNASEPQFSPGDLIEGVYQVISFIGAGGMSDVYKCRDISVDRIVAVKALQSGYTEESLRRFQTEGKAIARLEHPHIVKLYGLQAAGDGEPVLVMEYIGGDTLSDVLKKNSSLSIDRVLNITNQICDALTLSEREGIVHRDLKPSNIMLTNPGTSDETVKILDFGIAKIRDSANHDATKTGDIFGTPNYMSPEQALGKKCDARADQYALGCIMFEMLSGRPPFTSENILSVILMHVQNPVPTVTDVTTKHLPSHLAYIVRKMMQKKPDDRYASFGEVAKALKTVGGITQSASRKVVLYAVVAVMLAGMLLLLFYKMHTHPASPANLINILRVPAIANSLPAKTEIKSLAEIKPPTNGSEMTNYLTKVVDAELNATYKKVIQKYAFIGEFKPKLLAAEQTWIAYRDAHLKALYPSDSETSHSDCYEQELMEVTAYRNKELSEIEAAAKKPERDAKKALTVLDVNLDKTLKVALKNYTGADPRFLQQSQQKWRIFRDAEADLHQVLAKPGENEEVRQTTLLNLDRARYVYLYRWAKGVNEAGARCAGTRPIQ